MAAEGENKWTRPGATPGQRTNQSTGMPEPISERCAEYKIHCNAWIRGRTHTSEFISEKLNNYDDFRFKCATCMISVYDDYFVEQDDICEKVTLSMLREISGETSNIRRRKLVTIPHTLEMMLRTTEVDVRPS